MKKDLRHIPKAPTIAERQARKLVDDMSNGIIRFNGSKNKYPHFPGENERRDHYGYISFLESNDGKRCIDGMKRQDATYKL